MTHLFDPPSASPKDDQNQQNNDSTQSLVDQTTGSVLKNPNFLALWGGQVFSQIADKIYLILVIGIISSRFQQQGETISGWGSSVMVAFTIPAILFGSIAGVYVDRWSKKLTLVLSNLLRGALVFAIPLVLWVTSDLPTVGNSRPDFLGLLVITFIVSTLTQFFTPAEQASITLVVEKPKLLAANSIYATTIMAALILGFAVGEPLLTLADYLCQQINFLSIGKEVLVGGSYTIAGLILLWLQTGEKAEDLASHESHLWADIKDGLRYLNTKNAAKAALLQLVFSFSIIAALTVLAIRIAEVIPEIRSDQFGFLLAVASIGMAIGAAIVSNFGQKTPRHLLALIGSIGMGSFLAGLALFTAQLVPALTMIGCLGIFAGMCVIPMQTVIQEETSEAMRGKVFGLQNNAVNIALSLPLALVGLAESYFGLETVIISLSLISLISGVWIWQVARKAIV
ncbi:major facilitator superfamily MFS_1 [Thalassoporum mexicanum PCC 7367]|uniref:MFS transporter n=1 Tax=Thalassoporum mexicanum TaxID=3457544 RepID=UPI00029FC221|nr:MFS transporter [Pseudanabaena sp. PCC 7367]AFY71857.1 major facilitator superfamily MFS_1 [Pseudanabaena sp. PCC 7367]